MKTYVCDSCQKTISDPYEANMKEFCYTPEYNGGVFYPVPCKHGIRIHLCEECFRGLNKIAKAVEE